MLLVKPTTYMNRSGFAAVQIEDLYDMRPEDMLIVMDDYHIKLGEMRLRIKGSSGGHKGLMSIIDMTGTDEIPRLRIGTGPPDSDDAVDFVLSEFDDKNRLKHIIEDASDAVDLIIKHDMDYAMNLINQRRIDE
ncbi:MAG: aminoacyl-tRNA hydrolase [candidate division WOR-3 bacterium]|nr:aminoacyl-tRNA hydrolase [candidate division WOR-3 bacterium]